MWCEGPLRQDFGMSIDFEVRRRTPADIVNPPLPRCARASDVLESTNSRSIVRLLASPRATEGLIRDDASPCCGFPVDGLSRASRSIAVS